MTGAASEATWAERVSGWRASGSSASKYAEEKGYSVSSLRYWVKRLSRAVKAPRMVRLVPTSQAVSTSGATPELVVEIGSARVRVGRGFDAELLAEVVRALGGAR